LLSADRMYAAWPCSDAAHLPGEQYAGLGSRFRRPARLGAGQDPRGEAHDFRYSLDCTRIREETGVETAYGIRLGSPTDGGVVSGEPGLG
jgi:hypothetical protein